MRYSKFLLVPLAIALIAIDPPVVLFVLFGGFALSGPIGWSLAQDSASGRATAAAGRGRLSRWTRDAARSLEALGVTAYVPRRGRAGAPAAQAAAGPAAMDWKTLAATVRECTLCGLCATRTQTVFGTGRSSARG